MPPRTNLVGPSCRCVPCNRSFAGIGYLNQHNRKYHRGLRRQTAARQPVANVTNNNNNANEEEVDRSSVETYPNAGRPISVVQRVTKTVLSMIAPFKRVFNYNLVLWMIRSNASQTKIEEYFDLQLAGDETSDPADPNSRITSVHHMKKQIALMDTAEGMQFQNRDIDFNVPGCPPSKLFWRSPIAAAKYLLGQACYARHLVYAPQKIKDRYGERVYSEMHTGQWWWSKQRMIEIGGTLVPLIFFSDGTHLTNFSGDKKAWPIYMTIGNLPSSIRNAPSNHAVVLVALMPIQPKKKGLKKAQKDHIAQVVQDTLYDVLQPLEDVVNGIEIPCGDGYVRKCFPILSAWVADHMEYVDLFGIKANACPRCEIAPEQLGNNTVEAPIRDYEKYHELRQAYKDLEGNRNRRKEKLQELTAVGVHPVRIGISRLPNVCVEDIHKPDLLHGQYKGLLLNIIDWSMMFLAKHGKQNSFDAAWCRLDKYPNFPGWKIAFSQTTQWQGKEYRNAGKVLLATLTAALQNPTNAQRPQFNNVLTCVRAYLNFYMMAHYTSHTESTLQDMERYWRRFNEHRAVFNEFRVVKSKENLDADFRQQQTDAAEMLNANALSRAEYDAQVQLNRELYDEDLSILDGFNYPKMHLPNHYTEHIKLFGHLQGFSTDVGELAHRKQIKDGYRHSNKNNPFQQILDFYNRKNLFRMVELNLIHYARQSPENFWEIHSLFPTLEQNNFSIKRYGKFLNDQAVILDPVTVTWPLPDLVRPIGAVQLKGPRKDIRTIKQMVREFQVDDIYAPLGIYLDGERYAAISAGRTASGEALPDNLEQIRAIVGKYECRVFQTCEVLVQNLDETTSAVQHPIRATGNKKFHKECRADFFFYNRPGQGNRGILGGRGVARAEVFFKLVDPQLNGVVHDLVFATELEPDAGGQATFPSGLLRLTRARDFDFYAGASIANPRRLADAERKILPVQCLMAAAHLVPIPTNSRQYLLNSYIDRANFHDFYAWDPNDPDEVESDDEGNNGVQLAQAVARL